MGTRFALAVACALGSSMLPSSAHADAHTNGQWDALLAGEIVKAPQRIDHGARRYVGGVSYVLAEVAPHEVAALADDVRHYTSFLPYTQRAHLVGENDGDRFVEMTSGSALLQVRYTLRFRRTSERELRFWLDPSKLHDVPDAWGFLRWREVDTPLGPRTLVTFGVLAELPDDLTRPLFEGRVQHALLGVLPRLTGQLADQRVARAALSR